MSLVQVGYDQGLQMGNFEWLAGLALIILSLVFAPFYLRSKIATALDFWERRYSYECRNWLAIACMISAVVVTDLAVLHGVFGIDQWTCILLMCGLTAIYTVPGGLVSVVITETIQVLILLGGAVLMLFPCEGRKLVFPLDSQYILT